MPFEEILLSDEMLQLANGDDGERAEATSIGKVDNGDEVVVRTMEVPKWLSNTDVTKHLVGSGKKARLEEEYECSITLTGHGSGTKDPSLPGFNLDHLLITLKGSDIRQLGRVRRALEDSLIEYVIERTYPNASTENTRNMSTPPCLGRLLYALALSNANASPKTKDHTLHRTILSRAHYPMSHLIRAYQAARQHNRSSEHEHYAPPTKKVWMNIKELPQDENTGEFHGRFLAGKNGSLLEYYRTKFHCKVEIFGVWKSGDDDENCVGHDLGLGVDPYVLVTSEESKSCVDRCLQFIEHRIREHEEKWGVCRRAE
ncbi:hypothetical protein ACHAXS_007124 [Conticribra weissflogii]